MFLSSISEQGFGPVSWHLSARDPASSSVLFPIPRPPKFMVRLWSLTHLCTAEVNCLLKCYTAKCGGCSAAGRISSWSPWLLILSL